MMDKYLMMLYVTLDQERALKQFFIEHGWLFSKPDLCVTTDKLGPLLTLSTNTEDSDQSITTSEHSINVPASQYVGTKSNKKRKQPTKLSRSPASKQSKSEQSPHNAGDLTKTKTHHGTILTQTRSSNTSQSSAISNLSKIVSQSVKNVDDNTSTTPSNSSDVLAHEPNDTNVDFPLTLQCSNQEQVVVKLENVEDIEDVELEQPVHQMNQSECSEMENVDECSEIENVDNNEDNDPEDSNDFSDNTMEHHDDTMNEVLGLGAALDTDSKSTMLKPYTSSKQSKASERGSYRSYNQESLNKAYIAVKEGLSINKASRVYGVPKTTLKDRLDSNVGCEATKSGPPPLFNKEQETLLVSHLKTMDDAGCGYSKQEIINLATDYAIHLGLRDQHHPLTDRWYYNFVKRWPDMAVKKRRSSEVSRNKSDSEEAVYAYYNKLDQFLSKYNLHNKPHRIFIIDEKGLSIEHKQKEVTSGKNVTLIGCVSATGQVIPPYLVFPGSRMLPALLDGATEGTAGNVTETGWSNSEIFSLYLQQHLIKFLPSIDQDNLILYNGQKSHLTIPLIEWTKCCNIHLFVTPPQGSNLFQPLDNTCVLGPFEVAWNSVVHNYIRDSTDLKITRYDVCKLACKVYTSSLTTDHVKSVFRNCGIQPFAIMTTDEQVQGNSDEEERLDKSLVETTSSTSTTTGRLTL